jgi:hypothetical protein
MLFYGARVSALPAAQIQSMLSTQAKLINPKSAAATMTVCAQSMERSLKTLQALSAQLQSSKK